MNKPSPRLVLVVTFLLAALIVFWGIAFNYGSLKINSEVLPFEVKYSDTSKICDQSPCGLKLKPKTYDLVVSADNYTTLRESISIERAKNEELTYLPVLLPKLNKTNEYLEYKAAYFAQEENQQRLYLKTLDRGDIVVSSFKTSLESPEIRVSSNQEYLIVWDQNLFPHDFFLIKVSDKSKQALRFQSNEDLLGLEFIGGGDILLEYSDGVMRYSLADDTYTPFPLDSLKHHIMAGNSKSLILSTKSLDEYEFAAENIINIDALLDTTNEDGELEPQEALSYKLYYYYPEQGSFVYLLDLNDAFAPPYELLTQGDINQQEIVLSSNDNYYRVELGL